MTHKPECDKALMAIKKEAHGKGVPIGWFRTPKDAAMADHYRKSS